MNERLSRRPLDPRRQLPVPYVQVIRADGSADFAAVDAEKAVAAARQRLCGLCGEEIGYWCAFIGGPGSIRVRSFGDPPMCLPCAVDALSLCPHLARERVPRRPGGEGVTVPEGWVERKPDRFGLYVTRSWRVELHPAAGGGWTPVFLPAPAKEVRWYRYQDGRLTPEK